MKKINLLLFVFVISNLFLSCATTIETVKNDSPFILKDDEGFILLRILNPNVGKVIDEFYYSNGETAKKGGVPWSPKGEVIHTMVSVRATPPDSGLVF